MKKVLSYEGLGASATKDGLHKILDKVSDGHNQKYFCQLIEDFAFDKEYASFIHCDGAGTKTIIPYLHFKINKDPQYFSRLAEDAFVMNSDDVYCLGTPSFMTVANTIARNSQIIPDLAIEYIIKGYKEISAKLQNLGVPILLSGGETADCGDTVRTLVVDATMAGRIKKTDLINPEKIKAGDVIVGLASFGKATYEEHENSGIGSNGLTLARHALLSKEHAKEFPEILNNALSSTSSYVGPYHINDKPRELGTTIGDALSSPTRTYAPILSKIYEEHFNYIHGVIHLTGGAHGKVLRFIKNLRIIKDQLFEAPPIFKLINEAAQIEDKEMYRVFNMGQRMEIYCDQSVSQNIIDISQSFGVNAKIIGHVEDSKSLNSEVLIKNSSKEIKLGL